MVQSPYLPRTSLYTELHRLVASLETVSLVSNGLKFCAFVGEEDAHVSNITQSRPQGDGVSTQIFNEISHEHQHSPE